MPASPEDEIRGDWSNLKGTHYHLVYVLWLLLCRNVGSVAFYRGNDLLATVAEPPKPEESGPVTPAVHLETDEGDEWIQLKATRDPWTCTRLLRDNLLANFLYNALTSRAAERRWRACLVTQGDIRQADIAAFVTQPERFPDLWRNMEGIVERVKEQWERQTSQPLSHDDVRALALQILSQLAEQEPISLSEMKSAVELRLAYRYLAEDAVRHVGDLLLGALLRDAAAGPAQAHPYDHDWLTGVVGVPLKPQRPFDLNVVGACDLAVRAAAGLAGVRWIEHKCIARAQLQQELEQFLRAPETVFVLLGAGGTGKSWALADWTARILEGRVRLLIPSSDLDHPEQRGLSRLVEQRLRAYTSAPISDVDLLAKLRAVAGMEGRGPLVVAIEDLAPTADLKQYRRDLANLVAQCRADGVKLVLSCQTHAWEVHRLGFEIDPTDVYVASAGGAGRGVADAGSIEQSDKGDSLSDERRRRHSLALGDFTPQELEQVVRVRLPAAIADGVINRLRTPQYAFFRRPYLLERYLESGRERFSAPGEASRVVRIDDLLDAHLSRQSEAVAAGIDVDDNDLRDAFAALLRALWEARPRGLTMAQAQACLNEFLPDRSRSALDELREVGLLTAQGNVRIAEAPLEDHLFARALLARHADPTVTADELRPDADAGVAVALLRGLASADPLPMAEALLRSDPGWRVPVAEGLSHCSPQDYRVLALLTGVMRTDEGDAADEEFDACDALGHLAAYGARAYAWALYLYLSDRSAARLRGGRALGATLQLEPARVGRAIGLRLARAARVKPRWSWTFSSREDREEFDASLDGALTPLLRVDHPAAARIGQRIVARAADLREPAAPGDALAEDAERGLGTDIDEARGLIALFDDAEMARVTADLRAPEATTRDHAAAALRTMVFDQPERVREALCDAIRREPDWYVMNRLLWATYRLTELAPDALLDALNGSFALDWPKASRSTGQTLATLANLARLRPERVATLLPVRFEGDSWPGWARAWLSEGLAFAWWACAEQVERGRDVLAQLTMPAMPEVPDEHRLLALRGAAVAHLGRMCLSLASAAELGSLQTPYPGTHMQVLFVNTTGFVRRHARELLALPGAATLVDLLAQALAEHERAAVHPINGPLFKAHSICAHLCLEMLVALATAHAEPLTLVRRVPAGWRQVYAARRLLEAGCIDPELVAFARELCDGPISGRDVRELGERERCLKALHDVSQPPAAIVDEMRVHSVTSPITADDRARALAELADEHPADLLGLLAGSLHGPGDLPALHEHAEAARSWQDVLVTRVYGRMFDGRRIGPWEARELTEQMLVGIRGLPPSAAHRDEYEAVYSTLRDWLVGEPHPMPPLPAVNDAIQRSHAIAAALLRGTSASSGSGEEAGGNRADDLVNALAATRGDGWWVASGMKLAREGVSVGSGEIVYVFPVVRLALVALAMHRHPRGPCDPAARLMAERRQVGALLAKHQLALNAEVTLDTATLESALEALSDPRLPAGRDIRLALHRSTLLLRLGRLDAAEQALNACSSVPAGGDERASVLYNLGCVYARTGRDEECRDALVKSGQLAPFFGLRRDWLLRDPDLESVRDKEWFRALLGQEIAE